MFQVVLHALIPSITAKIALNERKHSRGRSMPFQPARRRLSKEARQHFFGSAARHVTAETCKVRQDAHFINWGPRIDGVFKEDQREICVISIALKSEPDKWRQYYVGRHVAQELLEFAGEKKLIPLSNLSKSFSDAKKSCSHDETVGQHERMTPLNRELSNVLDILIDWYHIIPREGKIFKEVQEEIKNYPEKDIPIYKVRHFGFALSKCNKSLDQMLLDVQAGVVNPRDFSFPLLTKIWGGSPSVVKSPPPPPPQLGSQI
jgi:hypothetical protein